MADLESMDKPLLGGLLGGGDGIDPIDQKDRTTEHRTTVTGTGISTRTSTGMDTGRGHSERTMAHPVAIKLLCEYHMSDVEGWLRAWAEHGTIPLGLKKAARKIKLSKASVTEWLNTVDVEERTPPVSGRHTAPLLPPGDTDKYSGQDGGEGGGSTGGGEGGGDGADGADGADGEEEEEEAEGEEYAWRTSVILDNLYEEVRDMYLAPRRWPGKGKVRWIQGYGSGYFLTVPSPSTTHSHH